MPQGTLQVSVFEGESYVPIENAKITIIPSQGRAEVSLKTDDSGRTEAVNLETPLLEYSQKPGDKLPYSLYDIKVQAPGYDAMAIKGCQIYPDNDAIQNCTMKKTLRNHNRQEEIIEVIPNRLVSNYPEKIPEDPDLPDPKPPSGFVVLPQPVVPQYIIVHQGGPEDTSAMNYKVKFQDYIKNVASCEIFATWPETTIRANILCILSFTLNRIYTEFYRGKGKNFDITSSTAYDHAFSYGRNIYKNISRVVDDIFTSYMKRPGKKQPLLSQYCDGVKVQCAGWLTQWGSKYQGDTGKTPFEILKYFYGSDLALSKANKVIGIPKSYPGYALSIGSKGDPVRTVQTYLNRISNNYPAISKVIANGTFAASTKKSVTEFQKIFYLPETGVVNYATWYKISDIYVAVTKIAELRVDRLITRNFIPPHFFESDGKIPYIEYLDDM